MRRALAVVVVGAALVSSCIAAAATSGKLRITYWPHGRTNAATTWTLSCAPARGTHPARRAACRTLSAYAADLGPATSACTVMPRLNGPEARVTGTWHGRRIDRGYRPGCPGWSDLHVVLTAR